jgi:hypothetical protein
MPISDVNFGGSGAGQKLEIENISDQANGSRQIFTLSNDYESGSLRVYWNGIRQSGNEITEITSATFQTSFQAAGSSSLIVEFYKS